MMNRPAGRLSGSAVPLGGVTAGDWSRTTVRWATRLRQFVCFPRATFFLIILLLGTPLAIAQAPSPPKGLRQTSGESAPSDTRIFVSPGESIQGAVDANPEGATFFLRSGVHRLQTVAPKTGDTFTGEAGAILSGARLLTAFTREGAYWVASGQTQEGPLVGQCQSSYPRCSSPEETFIDNRRLQPATSLGAVGPGVWFFDYAADKLYLGDNPTGHTVETTVIPFAFQGIAVNVTIAGLTVEKYANPAQQGAINGYWSKGWLVQGNTVRWNHGAGIQTGDRMQVLNNVVTENGQMGVSGSGLNVLVQDNEIALNNTAGFDVFWEAGGSKWVQTDGLIVRRNFSHHNHGFGLWTDISNINSLYEDNRVEDNDLAGIFHEISYRAVIRGNTLRRNGTTCPLDWCGAGIVVSASSDVEIANNITSDNQEGILAIHDNRGSGTYGPYRLKNLNVHNNTIGMKIGQTGLVQYIDDPTAYTNMNNHFKANTYILGSKDNYFTWEDGWRTIAEWRAFGNDADGVFTK